MKNVGRFISILVIIMIIAGALWIGCTGTTTTGGTTTTTACLQKGAACSYNEQCCTQNCDPPANIYTSNTWRCQ